MGRISDTISPASRTRHACAHCGGGHPRSAHRQPVQRPLAGLYLSGCHGVTGYKNAYPSYRVPKIGGQSSQYLTQALTEYRQGKRKHPTMQAQAQSFSEQDIADISAYLSTLK